MVYSELNKKGWDAISRKYQNECGGLRKIADVDYGPLLGGEKRFKLIKKIKGKTILEIGCGAGENSVFFAKKGAKKVLALDISEEQLSFGKKLAEFNGVHVDFIQGNAQTLPQIKSNSVDLAFSVFAFLYIPDLGLCFKEVSRVLKKNGLFVFSLDHPVWLSGKWVSQEFVWEKYWKKNISQNWGTRFGINKKGELFQHTIEAIFSALVGNKFLVLKILEPTPFESKKWGAKSDYARRKLSKVPSTIIVKATKK